MMRAVVLDAPGPPEALTPRAAHPPPAPGWVLIRVKAFGLNRSELHTRLGLAEGVTFPRVLGIEATGVVAAAPGGEFAGRPAGRHDDGRDGPHLRRRLRRVHLRARRARSSRSARELDWATLGAVPEMLQTAYGSLTVGLDAQPGQTLLIRGGTSSVGMAAAVLAKRPRPDRPVDHPRARPRERRSQAIGVDHVARRRRRDRRAGARDRARRRRRRARARRHADPARHAARDARPRRRLLHRDAQQPVDRPRLLSDRLPAARRPAHRVQRRRRRPARRACCRSSSTPSPPARLTVPIDRTYTLDEIAHAHADMEAGNAAGKLVVLP